MLAFEIRWAFNEHVRVSMLYPSGSFRSGGTRACALGLTEHPIIPGVFCSEAGSEAAAYQISSHVLARDCLRMLFARHVIERAAPDWTQSNPQSLEVSTRSLNARTYWFNQNRRRAGLREQAGHQRIDIAQSRARRRER